jgi:hypothetical protein
MRNLLVLIRVGRAGNRVAMQREVREWIVDQSHFSYCLHPSLGAGIGKLPYLQEKIHRDYS